MVSESILFTLLKEFDSDVKKTTTWEWSQFEPYFLKTAETIIPSTKVEPILPRAIPRAATPMKTESPKPFQGLLFPTIWHSIQGYTFDGRRRSLELREEINEKQKMIAALSKMPLKDMQKSHTKITKAQWDELISDLLTLSVRRQEYPSCFGPLSTNLLETILYSYYYQKTIVFCCPNKKIYTLFSPNEVNSVTELKQEDSLYFRVIKTAGGTLFEEMPSVSLTADWVRAFSAVTLLKAISNYKLAELKSLYSKLVGNVPENMKKQDLYKETISHKV